MTDDVDRNNILLTAAADMTQAIRDLGNEIKDTKVYAQRTRRLAKMLAVSVAFDIALSVGLYMGFRRADDASAKATKASSVNVVNCISGNESRRIQTELWNTVLQYPAPAAETPEAKTRREQQTQKFKDYIATAFAQRDCTKVG